MRRFKKLTSVLLASMMAVTSFAPMSVGAETTAVAETGLQASYKFTGEDAARPGYGAGTITITPGVSTQRTGYYVLFWANEDGVLSGYEPITAIAITGSTVKYEMVDHVAIPYGATKLAIFESTSKTVEDTAIANAAAVYEIPEEKQFAEEDVEFSFASVSDVHINYDANGYGASTKWIAALNYFEELGLEAVVISGDMTGSGTTTEYKNYEAASKSSAFAYENIYEARGNHDALDVNNFITYTMGDDEVRPYENAPYFYKLFEGEEGEKDNLFIFMAQELTGTSNTSKQDNFSDAQMDWIEGVVEEYAGTETNIFIVEHSFFRNWGPGDRYNGAYTDAIIVNESYPGNARFKALLQQYKEIMFMSGHSHVRYSEMVNFSDIDGTAARMIHNSSTSQPRSYTASGSLSYNSEGLTTETKGSEGYVVYVYGNEIVYQGTNLTTQEIVPTACYIMPSYVEDRASAVSIEVTTPPAKTDYKAGESFEPDGMVVTATYEDGSKVVVDGWTYFCSDPLTKADKEVQITYGKLTTTVAITVSDMFRGDGTKESPYKIETAEDFKNFTDQFATIVTTDSHSTDVFGKGLYFVQTADIDMTGVAGYAGTATDGNAKHGFSGVYDGQGYTLKVDIHRTSKDAAIFPYVNGIVMNVNFTGEVEAATNAQIVRTLGKKGLLINCKSDVTLIGSENASGLCYTCYGYVFQFYATGTLDGGTKNNVLAISHSSDTLSDVYHYEHDIDGNAVTSSSKGTRSNDGTAIAESFNDHTKDTAQTALAKMQAIHEGVTLDDLCAWTTDGSCELIAVNDYEEETAQAVSIEVTTLPTKNQYKDGEIFDPAGMVVTATYEDGSKAVVSGWTYSCAEPLTKGNNTVQIMYGELSTTIEIAVSGMFFGEGTKENPYKIETAEDFKKFTDQFASIVATGSHDTNVFGKGLYFAQTADIDMTGVSGYAGTATDGNARHGFSGVYDGQGYTLKVDIHRTDKDAAIFPYVNGIVMNVNFTGTVEAAENAQVVRTLGRNGLVINCKSDVDLIGSKNASGLCYTSYGYVFQFYATGTLDGGTKNNVLAISHSDDTLSDVYHYEHDTAGNAVTSSSKGTRSDDGAAIAASFNDHTKTSAQTALAKMQAVNAAITLDDLCLWTTDGSCELIAENDYKVPEVLTIIKQPVDTGALQGEDATVTVDVVGDGLTYKWFYKNPGNVKFYESGDAFVFDGGAAYSIPMAAWRDGQEVYCEITDKYGDVVQTNIVTLTLEVEYGTIQIEKQPEDVSVDSEGKHALVSVTAKGNDLTYTWYYKNPGNVKFYKSGDDFVYGSKYVIDLYKWRDGQQVYCVITDGTGASVQTNTVTLSIQK